MEDMEMEDMVVGNDVISQIKKKEDMRIKI